MNAKQKHPESNDKALFHVVAQYRHFIDYVILPVQLKYSVYRQLRFDCIVQKFVTHHLVNSVPYFTYVTNHRQWITLHIHHFIIMM